MSEVTAMKKYSTPTVELSALCTTDVVTFSGLAEDEPLATKDVCVSFNDSYWFDDVGRVS